MEWTKFYVQTEYLPKPFCYILEQKHSGTKPVPPLKDAVSSVSLVS